MYEHTDFEHIDNMLNVARYQAHTHGFDIISVDTYDDWVSPGDLIVHVYMRRSDLDLLHDYTFRSNGKRVTNNSDTSLRAKVRGRYGQLVRKLERRLNRSTPDADGLYRRTPPHG